MTQGSGDRTYPSAAGFDPTELGLRDSYRLLTACVAPRPIAFVSTVSAAGVRNLAPFSFFMAGGGNPPSVVISPLKDSAGREKDTLVNIRETGEYVVHAVSFEAGAAMNVTSASFPPEEDEWIPSGLTPVASVKVRPERVAECSMAMECRLHQIVPHGSGPLSANYIIGEVVYFHIARHLLEDGGVDCTKVDYISRLAGDWYCRVQPSNLFEMPRPAG